MKEARERIEEDGGAVPSRQSPKQAAPSGQWIIAREFVEAGIGGSDKNRPAIRRLLDPGTGGGAPVDAVVVQSFSRLARDQLVLRFEERSLGDGINPGGVPSFVRRWRSGRDSNPRYGFAVYSLSRRAPSTTRPPLRCSWRAAHLERGRGGGKPRLRRVVGQFESSRPANFRACLSGQASCIARLVMRFRGSWLIRNQSAPAIRTS
jgi:hypothetical protein